MAEEKDVIDDIELEVVDDTPPEDQGREPMPKELVKELEEDELEDYSEKVKSRLKQMKKQGSFQTRLAIGFSAQSLKLKTSLTVV